MRCPNCGSKAAPKIRFCGNCGAAIPEEGLNTTVGEVSVNIKDSVRGSDVFVVRVE